MAYLRQSFFPEAEGAAALACPEREFLRPPLHGAEGEEERREREMLGRGRWLEAGEVRTGLSAQGV